MANTRSAKKMVRKIEQRTEVNKARRSRVRTYVRKVEEAIASGDSDKARDARTGKKKVPVVEGVGWGDDGRPLGWWDLKGYWHAHPHPGQAPFANGLMLFAYFAGVSPEEAVGHIAKRNPADAGSRRRELQHVHREATSAEHGPCERHSCRAGASSTGRGSASSGYARAPPCAAHSRGSATATPRGHSLARSSGACRTRPPGAVRSAPRRSCC